MLPPPVLSQPRAERVAQERERRDLMIATPVGVLAINHTGLIWVQLQSDLRQPRCQGIPYHHGLLLAGAVNYRIIGIPLNPAGFPGPGLPKCRPASASVLSATVSHPAGPTWYRCAAAPP